MGKLMPRNMFKIYQRMCGDTCSPTALENIAKEIIEETGDICHFIIPTLADNFLEMKKNGETSYDETYMTRKGEMVNQIYFRMKNNAKYILSNPKKINSCKIEQMIDPEKNETIKEKLVKRMPHEFEARILVEFMDTKMQKAIEIAKTYLTQIHYDKEEIIINKLENLIQKLVRITS